MESQEFIFKEVISQEDLLHLFQLRYTVYNKINHLRIFCPENEYEMDIDEYDIRSRHFGLYLKETDQETPIGYIRIIQDKVMPSAENIKIIARAIAPKLFKKVTKSPLTPFPGMNYFTNSGINVSLLIDESRNNKSKICEGSRFIFLPKYRSKGLSKFILDCIVAITFYHLNMDEAILCCTLSHSHFYKRYGFQSIEEVIPKIKLSTVSATIMVLKKEQVPISLCDKLQNIAADFSKHQLVNLTL